MKISPARQIAFRTLLEVERGAYASDLLFASSTELDSRDARLASEIVFGVLRYQSQLDYLIQHYSGKQAGALDPEVRISLRMGIYQLRYLERIPPHAAVGESVELVKRARKHSAAGYINATLRKVNRQPVGWPDRAIELSHPAWLLEKWDRQFGLELATGIARANLRPPPTYVRIPRGLPLPQDLELEPTGIVGCYRVLSGNPAGLQVQDIGSQSIVPLLGLAPGQRFLDLCAAPGNKTLQALESGVRAVACDIHLQRLARLRSLGVDTVVLDGTRPLPFGIRFHRILVDAPCSGTGTLARNPEIKWRLRPSAIQDLQAIQVALLRHAVAHLASRGRLVYSTCSLESEENEGVVSQLQDGFRIATVYRVPGREPGDGYFAAVIE